MAMCIDEKEEREKKNLTENNELAAETLKIHSYEDDKIVSNGNKKFCNIMICDSQKEQKIVFETHKEKTKNICKTFKVKKNRSEKVTMICGSNNFVEKIDDTKNNIENGLLLSSKNDFLKLKEEVINNTDSSTILLNNVSSSIYLSSSSSSCTTTSLLPALSLSTNMFKSSEKDCCSFKFVSSCSLSSLDTTVMYNSSPYAFSSCSDSQFTFASSSSSCSVDLCELTSSSSSKNCSASSPSISSCSSFCSLSSLSLSPLSLSSIRSCALSPFTDGIYFRKTRMCVDFVERGKCERYNCCYAHYESEKIPSVDLSKTKLCWSHMKKKCHLSSKDCKFAHNLSELRGVAICPTPSYRSNVHNTESLLHQQSSYLNSLSSSSHHIQQTLEKHDEDAVEEEEATCVEEGKEAINLHEKKREGKDALTVYRAMNINNSKLGEEADVCKFLLNNCKKNKIRNNSELSIINNNNKIKRNINISSNVENKYQRNSGSFNQKKSNRNLKKLITSLPCNMFNKKNNISIKNNGSSFSIEHRKQNNENVNSKLNLEEYGGDDLMMGKLKREEERIIRRRYSFNNNCSSSIDKKNEEESFSNNSFSFKQKNNFVKYNNKSCYNVNNKLSSNCDDTKKLFNSVTTGKTHVISSLSCNDKKSLSPLPSSSSSSSLSLSCALKLPTSFLSPTVESSSLNYSSLTTYSPITSLSNTSSKLCISSSKLLTTQCETSLVSQPRSYNSYVNYAYSSTSSLTNTIFLSSSSPPPPPPQSFPALPISINSTHHQHCLFPQCQFSSSSPVIDSLSNFYSHNGVPTDTTTTGTYDSSSLIHLNNNNFNQLDNQILQSNILQITNNNNNNGFYISSNNNTNCANSNSYYYCGNADANGGNYFNNNYYIANFLNHYLYNKDINNNHVNSHINNNNNATTNVNSISNASYNINSLTAISPHLTPQLFTNIPSCLLVNANNFYDSSGIYASSSSCYPQHQNAKALIDSIYHRDLNMLKTDSYSVEQFVASNNMIEEDTTVSTDTRDLDEQKKLDDEFVYSRCSSSNLNSMFNNSYNDENNRKTMQENFILLEEKKDSIFEGISADQLNVKNNAIISNSAYKLNNEVETFQRSETGGCDPTTALLQQHSQNMSLSVSPLITPVSHSSLSQPLFGTEEYMYYNSFPQMCGNLICPSTWPYAHPSIPYNFNLKDTANLPSLPPAMYLSRCNSANNTSFFSNPSYPHVQPTLHNVTRGGTPGGGNAFALLLSGNQYYNNEIMFIKKP